MDTVKDFDHRNVCFYEKLETTKCLSIGEQIFKSSCIYRLDSPQQLKSTAVHTAHISTWIDLRVAGKTQIFEDLKEVAIDL